MRDTATGARLSSLMITFMPFGKMCDSVSAHAGKLTAKQAISVIRLNIILSIHEQYGGIEAATGFNR